MDEKRPFLVWGDVVFVLGWLVVALGLCLLSWELVVVWAGLALMALGWAQLRIDRKKQMM